MKKAILAGLAAVTIIGSTAVYAQHRFHNHMHFSAEDRAAFTDARIAAVKAGLPPHPGAGKELAAGRGCCARFRQDSDGSCQCAGQRVGKRAAPSARTAPIMIPIPKGGQVAGPGFVGPRL